MIRTHFDVASLAEYEAGTASGPAWAEPDASPDAGPAYWWRTSQLTKAS